MTIPLVPVSHVTSPVGLSTHQFYTLAEVPLQPEWFANLTNANTHPAYQQDIQGFEAFAGLQQPEEFRDVTRGPVIAWRQQLTQHGLANDTIWRKLAALSSLYAHLCERHAVLYNPVLGAKRPCSMNRDGVAPALGDRQARMLHEAPWEHTLKGQRGRTILATLRYHGLRCEALCALTVGDIYQMEGVPHLRVEGKGERVRYLPQHALAQRLITAHLGSEEDSCQIIADRLQGAPFVPQNPQNKQATHWSPTQNMLLSPYVPLIFDNRYEFVVAAVQGHRTFRLLTPIPPGDCSASQF
jgi:site-specific recombinase XerD